MNKIDQQLYEDMCTMARALITNGANTETLEKHLAQKTDDVILIAVVIKEVKKEHYAKMRKEGLTWLAIGSVLIVTGFFITCFNFHSNKSFDFAMYGLTSIGIVVVFWGLFKMIG